MKKVFKTESVAEFLARGGKVNTYSAKTAYKKSYKPVKEPTTENVDMSALPTALKIRYGIK